MDDLELIGMDYLWRVRSFKNYDNILAVIYLRSRNCIFCTIYKAISLTDKMLYYFTQQMHNACNNWLQRSSVMISLFFNVTGCVIKSR